MTPQIYILLPIHNRRVITERFIDCLAAQTYSNYHLVLIDDGSTDGSDEMVKAKINHLTVLSGKGNWWWAGSLQQGIDWLKQNNVSDNEIVVFMNDDVTFNHDFLQIAVNILDKQDGGMLLPQIFDEQTGSSRESGIEADLKKLTFKIADTPGKINCLPTRALFMRMSDLRRAGNFFPKLLPHYLSDYEFTIRANRKGMLLKTSPNLLIRFDEGTTGYRSFNDLSLLDFLKRYFSIKSVSNPFYWTAFIVLAAPKLYVPWNVLRIWFSVVKLLLKRLMPT